MKKYILYYVLPDDDPKSSRSHEFETDGDQYEFAFNWIVNNQPTARIRGVYEMWE